MKKFIITIAIASSSIYASAQNSFPTSGNVFMSINGFIGNSLNFEGWGEAPFLRTESIGNSANGHTRLRLYLTDDWTYDQGFEIIAKRYDGPERSLLHIPGDGSQSNFFSGASFGGNVGIGTTTPDAKLSVNGTVHAKEIKVDLTGWPDYVFKPSYKLPSLGYVNAYIKKNGHLPEAPSEKDVAQNGVNLGDMNKLLLKKVEELTLHLIEKEKQITRQTAVNKKQDERITTLEKALLKLTK